MLYHWTARLSLSLALLILTVAGATSFAVAESAFLIAEPGYAVVDQEPDLVFLSHDAFAGQVASYGTAGLEIRDPSDGSVLESLGEKPADYQAANSFTTLDPTGNSVWVGFTNLGSTDDRVYQVDRTTGTWVHRATLTGNFDMEFSATTAYVSANPGAPSWSAENAVYRFDASGSNNHELVAEVGGYSAGLDFDSFGNLYYVPYDTSELIRFDVADVAEASGGSPLVLADATTLATLPAGSYDVEVDDADHVLFNVNTSTSFVALWDGTEGPGENYTKMASGLGDWGNWLTYLSAVGNVTEVGQGMAYATDISLSGAAEIRAVPEPGTVGILISAALVTVLLFRRRRSS